MHRNRVETRIANLEKRIKETESRLREAKADRKNPLSSEFPSGVEGHDNLASTLARELENAQDDLAILRQVAGGGIIRSREKFLRRQLPQFLEMRENVINITAGMQAELAAIQRAKQLLR